MLVKLYALPAMVELSRELAVHGVIVRRAMAYEKDTVVTWVERTFGGTAPGWKSECDVAFSRSPIACHIAVREAAIIGFACHDCTGWNFLGPIGVAEARRGNGIGRLLLITALKAMRDQGFAYAIVGQAGAPGFFSSTVDAMEIAGSESGIYPPTLEI